MRLLLSFNVMYGHLEIRNYHRILVQAIKGENFIPSTFLEPNMMVLLNLKDFCLVNVDYITAFISSKKLSYVVYFLSQLISHILKLYVENHVWL